MMLSIGVVGGSIAGCSAAILLERHGHDVQVFERSSHGLVGRGGGIATSGPVFQSLIDEDIIDPDFPHISASTMPMIVRTPDHKHLGYQPWEIPLDLKAFHWADLWEQLRKRVPDERYHRGREVVHVDHSNENRPSLVISDGSRQEFDLVIFADGYRSMGRQYIDPGAELTYRGYMLWRGLLPERLVDDPEPLGRTVPRVSYQTSNGNFVGYFVPDHDGSSEVGDRIVNWAAYIELPEGEVDAFMVDRDGKPHQGSLPPGSVPAQTEQQLKELMRENLPSYYSQIIDKTERTYVQLIYTARMQGYHSKRLCVIGDAGTMVQPFTGSGVFKGYNNVRDLISALDAEGDLEMALTAWGKAQTAIGDRLFVLGEQMEQAFIWDPLDLSNADAATTEAWWRNAVTYPDDFSLEKRTP